MCKKKQLFIDRLHDAGEEARTTIDPLIIMTNQRTQFRWDQTLRRHLPRLPLISPY
jgi:hypothetical protein